MTVSGRLTPPRSAAASEGGPVDAESTPGDRSGENTSDPAIGHADLAFRVPRRATGLMVVALVVGMGLSISFGASDMSLRSIGLALLDGLPFVDVDPGLSEAQRSILWQWRMPRAVLGALVGSSLALGGATYQGVFRNPLADPYLLGVAAGAGLGATLAIVSGADGGWGPLSPVPAAAFAGAVIAISIAAGIGFGSSRSPAALLLAGVAVASFLTAIQTYVMQRNSDTLIEVYSWILGRLGTFGWGEVALLTPYMVVCSAVILALRRQLDVLQLGDDEAAALGLSVRRVRVLLILSASLLAAAAVAVSGLITFVGIIVPHFIRITIGSSYRVVLPLSALGGAAFLVVADIGARNLLSGAELPIGVVTAFIGAPFFALVLWARRGSLT